MIAGDLRLFRAFYLSYIYIKRHDEYRPHVFINRLKTKKVFSAFNVRWYIVFYLSA